MTPDEIEAALGEELGRIAPDIELSEIDRDTDLREEFDIDSMDFLTLVTALGQRLGVEIPEADYPNLDSFDAALAYLAERLG